MSLKGVNTGPGGINELPVLHDILGVPIHHCILEIETFQVGNSSGLYFLWEAKVATQLGYFGDIQLDEKMFLVGVEELNIRRRARLNVNKFLSMSREFDTSLSYLHTESLSNVLRIAETAAWFNAVLVALNCSAENRQFLY